MDKQKYTAIKKLFRFAIILLARVVSYIAVFLAVLAFITVVGLYLFDKIRAHGTYTGRLLRYLIETGFFDGKLRTIEVAGVVLTAVLFAGLLVFKFILRKKFRPLLGTMPFYKVVAYVWGHALINISVLGCLLVLLVCYVVLGCIHSLFYDEPIAAGVDYADKVDYIHSQIHDRKVSASLVYSKIMLDVQLNPGYIDGLNTEEYKALCYQLNELMNMKDGPETIEEHFFRNKFDRAPETLDNMIDTILNDNSEFGWQLLQPAQSQFHMNGKDGEYNLKFVSSDGFFEAIYNKDGLLLVESNDPINMGTYNFADPVADAAKHSLYDMQPYFKWGNCPGMNFNPGELDKYMAKEEQFTGNPDAVFRYVKLYKMLSDGKSDGE